MSRANYSDDLDSGALNVWRGAVRSAIRGKRGQAFLRELAAAMDAMPDKRLAAGVAVTDNGCMCTLAVVGSARGMDLQRLGLLMEDGETQVIADELGIADAMAREVMYENDDGSGAHFWLLGRELPPAPPEVIEAKRWAAMRAWVASNLKDGAA